MTGAELKEKTSSDWYRAADVVTLLEEEIQRLRKQVCDQDEALVESAYAVSDAFKTAYKLRNE